MTPIPANINELVERIRSLSSFASWSSRSALTVEQIAIYCVPGNASQAKGRLAIWVRGPGAKRPKILFPELILRAMHFIAEPHRRGQNRWLDPGTFAGSVTGKDATLPGVHSNCDVYLAVARRLLGLPDDHVDPLTQSLEVEARERRKADRPDIRTRDGLLHEILLAYAAAKTGDNTERSDAAMIDRCYLTLRNRQGTMEWFAYEDQQRAALTAVMNDIRTDPGHADIRDIELAVFAMLYANGLHFARKIRGSAITTVVNHLADAADDGLLDGFDQQITQAETQRAARVGAMFQKDLAALMDEHVKPPHR